MTSSARSSTAPLFGGLVHAAGVPCRLPPGRRSARRQVRPTGRRLGLALTVAVAVGLGATGGSAFAFFAASGSGSATAQVLKATTVTVSSASATADLLPGGTGAASFTLQNSNPFAANFTSVTAASVSSNDLAHCSNANVSIAKTLPYTLTSAISVGANTTSGTLTIPGLVQLSSSAPSSCQGVTFTVTLTLSGAQQ